MRCRSWDGKHLASRSGLQQLAEVLSGPGVILDHFKENSGARPGSPLSLQMLLSDTASLVFIMVGPGYQGARERDLLPRRKDERDAGAQQFPWQQLEVAMRIESGETQRWEQDF